MKNKNLVIAVVVVVLILLLGVGGYLMLNKNAPSTSTQNTQQTTKDKTQSGQTTKSLLDLVKMGQNLRCTYKTTIANGSTEGTVYISGQNVRADFTVNVSGQEPAQTSMIRKGDTTYVWGSTMPDKGIKMTTSLDKMSEDKQTSQYVDPNQKINYSCSPWNVDSTLFTVPNNIEFTDMTSMMAPKASVTGTTTQNSSDPCAAIEDPTTKAACENALKQSGQ